MKVLIAIFVVIFAFIIIQTLNNMAKDESKEKLKEIVNKSVDKEITQSVIDEGKTSVQNAKNGEQIIEKFVTYCNNRDTKQAYSLLSDECKNILFPTETDFIKNYYNIVFNKYKAYELDNWMSNGDIVTYKIRFTNDALAEGGYKKGETIEDYYTIVKQSENNYKLNINKFVNREEINKKVSRNNFNITVLALENYIDYQIYEFNFKNESSYDVKTYDVIQKSDWSVIDKNGLKYSAFVEEIPDNNLEIKNGIEKNLKVKYAKMYNMNRKIESISFNNMYFIKNNAIELFSFNIEL